MALSLKNISATICPTIDRLFGEVSRGQTDSGHSAVVKWPVAMCPAAECLDTLSNLLVVNNDRSYRISNELSHKLRIIVVKYHQTGP